MSPLFHRYGSFLGWFPKKGVVAFFYGSDNFKTRSEAEIPRFAYGPESPLGLTVEQYQKLSELGYSLAEQDEINERTIEMQLQHEILIYQSKLLFPDIQIEIDVETPFEEAVRLKESGQ